ncbi:MAG: 5'-3' exonuclease H3TH domain-containing protein [Candidatus Paceibacterota bacterium]
MSRKKFLLVDGHALIYRSFFAFPKSFTRPDGQMINAVYGFSRILLTAIRNLDPLYMAVTFDHPAPTNRTKDFEFYKVNRPKMPEELRPQIAIIQEVVAALNIPQFKLEGYEADDLIGTINARVEERDKTLLTVILTGDQDMFQLVDNDTHVYLPGRGKGQEDTEYDEKLVKGKIGVRPDQVIELKGLMGDSSDNIPGVKGVGPKTAVALIEKFSSVDGVYEALDKQLDDPVFTPSLIKKLTTDRENAFLSRELATIVKNSPIKFRLEDCAVTQYNKEKVVSVFQDLNFKSLISLLPKDEFETTVQEALF